MILSNYHSVFDKIIIKDNNHVFLHKRSRKQICYGVAHCYYARRECFLSAIFLQRKNEIVYLSIIASSLVLLSRCARSVKQHNGTSEFLAETGALPSEACVVNKTGTFIQRAPQQCEKTCLTGCRYMFLSHYACDHSKSAPLLSKV